VECKLRCDNFRRVSDPRRAFLPALRVTGISDDWYRSTIGVTVIGLGTPPSAGANFRCTWEHRQQAWECRGHSWEHLGAPASSLGAPATSLGAPATSLGAPRITVEQSEKDIILFGNAAGADLEIIATAYRSTIFKTHVFSLYSHLCIYVSI